MLSWIIQISIISIIFIFLVHHLLCFFKTTLTVPKIKDLVNSPNKKYQQIFDTISNSNDSNTYAPIHQDLYSIYENVIDSNCVSVLEIGSGYSTAVLALALFQNKIKLQDKYEIEVGLKGAFKLISIEASNYFAELTLKRIPDEIKSSVSMHVSSPFLSSFNGQVCSFFPDFPFFHADFVYLDGPDPDQVVTLKCYDFKENNIPIEPMSGDLLRIENFIRPGTLVCVDGRGSNAKFLQQNFRRSWKYYYNSDLDQHFFKLQEKVSGRKTEAHLKFRDHGEEYWI